MKAPFKHDNLNASYRTAIAGLLLAGSITAYAIPANQVGRFTEVQTIDYAVCVSDDCPGFLPEVVITEPATGTPVIVTWSADYNTTGTSVVGLSLNGGPCLYYGPFTLQEPQLVGANSVTVATTHQWVVMPSDGLKKGTNTFNLCAGGYEIPQTINIGFSTLTVQSE